MVPVPVERESRRRVSSLDPCEGRKLIEALEAHREHVRDVLIETPRLIDDPGINLPVPREVRAAIDVMGVLNTVRRRGGHGVQIDRDGTGGLDRRATCRTRGTRMIGEVHQDPITGEGDREQLVERPVQIGEEKVPLGMGDGALITAFSHMASFRLPRRDESNRRGRAHRAAAVPPSWLPDDIALAITSPDGRDTHILTAVLGTTTVPQYGVQSIISSPPQPGHRAGPARMDAVYPPSAASRSPTYPQSTR